MTLRQRLAIGLVAIALVLITPLAIALAALYQVHGSTQSLRDREFRTSLLLARMRGKTADLRRAEAAMSAFLDEPENRRAVGAYADTLAVLTDSLRALTADTAALRLGPAIDAVREYTQQEYEAGTRGQQARADSISDRLVRPAIDSVQRHIEATEGVLAQRTKALVESSAAASAQAATVSAAALVAALLLAGAIAVWLTRSISGPLSDLERGMHAVADGQFDYRLRVAPDRGDEFGRLAASFTSMAEQLAALDRMKAEFVSIASHELKTPLNVILGYLQLLEEAVFGELNPKQREVLGTIGAQGRALTRLVNQLLDVSRLQAGGGRLDMRPLGLASFLEELEQSFRVLAMQRGIEFVVTRAEPLPAEVSWDADRMNEVLGNLLSNAFKFTERGGRVELAVDAADGVLSMEVRDTGVGIPAEQLPHIFEKFYQADNQKKAAARGSGLGLAIASEIVRAHGGQISVASTVGAGTTFSITMPIRSDGGGRRVARPARGRVLAST